MQKPKKPKAKPSFDVSPPEVKVPHTGWVYRSDMPSPETLVKALAPEAHPAPAPEAAPVAAAPAPASRARTTGSARTLLPSALTTAEASRLASAPGTGFARTLDFVTRPVSVALLLLLAPLGGSRRAK